MKFQIQEISHKATLIIRHKVMWPNKPIAYVCLPEDEKGRHFGLFVKGKLVSVISIFNNRKDIQFRNLLP